MKIFLSSLLFLSLIGNHSSTISPPPPKQEVIHPEKSVPDSVLHENELFQLTHPSHIQVDTFVSFPGGVGDGIPIEPYYSEALSQEVILFMPNYNKGLNITFYEGPGGELWQINTVGATIEEHKIIVNSAEFKKDAPKPIGGNYQVKNQSVYYEYLPLEIADFESFQVLDGPYAIDKNYVYYHGKIIEGADVDTFQATGQNARDKNHVYDGNIIVHTFE